MNVEKLAAIGEIVSSIAIVATLAYLALQTQQTNQALFSNSRAQIMSAEVQLAIAYANSPVSDYMRNVIQDLVPNLQLTDAEIADMARQANFLAGEVRIREFAWLQYQDGLLDRRVITSYSIHYTKLYDNVFPGGQARLAPLARNRRQRKRTLRR